MKAKRCRWQASLTLTLGAALLVSSGCGSSDATIAVDGSSTVYPITKAMAEEFSKAHDKVRVNVALSGTGGGFKKFCIGETDLNDASRPIKTKEQRKAEEHDIEYIELPVAYDGISIVVNPKNEFIDKLTVKELRSIWHPDEKKQYWSEVRQGWPHEEIKLFGPGADSGTFDYFTKAINGKEQLSRSDYTASEDDNVLVTGVAQGGVYALAFFGYAYYEENQSQLRAVPIDAQEGAGAIAPSAVTINDGSYAPLSRPIFIYVTTKAAERPVVQEFVRFYLTNAKKIVAEVGYVPLPDKVYEAALERFEKRITGTVFPADGKTIPQLYNAD